MAEGALDGQVDGCPLLAAEAVAKRLLDKLVGFVAVLPAVPLSFCDVEQQLRRTRVKGAAAAAHTRQWARTA